jgi:2-oxoglutarate/2-oxoacid ferredoxin oxidoreductase subunit alpha
MAKNDTNGKGKHGVGTTATLKREQDPPGKMPDNVRHPEDSIIERLQNVEGAEKLEVEPGGKVRLMSGNAACVEGALAAGCTFFGGYPISPATEIAEMMSSRLPAIGGKYIQMEDEIASMAAIIGASITGAKSMTATSGPGISLMQENIGYGIMTEIPCVIVNVQRGGPSTGLPTKPSQGDVMQARWGTHGDHSIIAVCPSSVEETFRLTIFAFNLSERFRTPVIILLDEVVAHMREKIVIPAPESNFIVNRMKPTTPPEWYHPYEETPSLVPPMASFGEGYRYNITGLTHDINGFPTQKLNEVAALNKRLEAKIERNLKHIVLVGSEFIDDADIAVFAYGSVARSARRAVMMARSSGVKVGLVRPLTIWPFPSSTVKKLASHVKTIIVPEMNQGQLVGEVERYSNCQCDVVSLKTYDCTLMPPERILEAILEANK